MSQLWLGDATRINDAIAAGCNAIVNVAEDFSDPVIPGVECTKVGLWDDGSTPCEKYGQAAKAVDDYISAGKTVYLHCMAGLSRSVATAILYRHIYRGVPLLKARDFVLTVYPEAKMWPSLWNSIVRCYDPPANN